MGVNQKRIFRDGHFGKEYWGCSKEEFPNCSLKQDGTRMDCIVIKEPGIIMSYEWLTENKGEVVCPYLVCYSLPDRLMTDYGAFYSPSNGIFPFGQPIIRGKSEKRNQDEV